MKYNKTLCDFPDDKFAIYFTDWDNDGRLDLIVDSQNACLFRNVMEKDGCVWFEYLGNISDTVLAGHTTSPSPSD